MLTNEQIESVLNALPIQARMMLKLLLLQYFEISQEDLDYLAADRPDPRFQSGYERTGQPVAREVAEDVTIRVAQYRKQVRQKREKFGRTGPRTWRPKRGARLNVSWVWPSAHDNLTAMLTNEQIESVLNALPIQARMMLKLLLLQYFEISQEDLDYLAADRPDPRFQSGYERTGQPVAREVAEDVTIRVAQYRKQVRQKREKFGLQMECLRRHMTVSETVVSLAEELLANRFGLDPEATQALKKQARTVVPKPAIRELERKWERDEITEDAYLKERLCIEYQTELRKLERQRKHFELAKREHRTVSIAPLQDHEVAHIWGIPAGSLAGRKVKALHQYLQGLQAALQKSDQAPAWPAQRAPLY